MMVPSPMEHQTLLSDLGNRRMRSSLWRRAFSAWRWRLMSFTTHQADHGGLAIAHALVGCRQNSSAHAAVALLALADMLQPSPASARCTTGCICCQVSLSSTSCAEVPGRLSSARPT